VSRQRVIAAAERVSEGVKTAVLAVAAVLFFGSAFYALVAIVVDAIGGLL
jgi:hypothetical protein